MGRDKRRLEGDGHQTRLIDLRARFGQQRPRRPMRVWPGWRVRRLLRNGLLVLAAAGGGFLATAYVEKSSQAHGAWTMLDNGLQPYFANCREAVQAGVAPLYQGQPGYGAWLDHDHDGIACEPYRAR
jgi:Excalibur calcium-binding domain